MCWREFAQDAGAQTLMAINEIMYIHIASPALVLLAIHSQIEEGEVWVNLWVRVVWGNALY